MSSAEVNTFTKSMEPMGITMDGVTALPVAWQQCHGTVTVLPSDAGTWHRALTMGVADEWTTSTRYVPFLARGQQSVMCHDVGKKDTLLHLVCDLPRRWPTRVTVHPRSQKLFWSVADIQHPDVVAAQVGDIVMVQCKVEQLAAQGAASSGLRGDTTVTGKFLFAGVKVTPLPSACTLCMLHWPRFV